MTSASVIVCAHNEERYIGDCLRSIRAQSLCADLVVVVADRCTDQTVAIAKSQLRGTPSIVVEKNCAAWRNSISENLQLGLSKAVGDVLVVIDADIILPRDFLATLLSDLVDCAVVSAAVRTDPSEGLLNRLVSLWELTYAFTPLGEQPRGGARVISIPALNAVGRFRDVYAWESDLDSRLRKAGYKVRLDRRVHVLHRRRMTVSHSVAYQIQAGRARRELGVSPLRTLLHSLVRLRPFVIVGYFGSSGRPSSA